jgi:hypothetical protein
MKILFVTSGKEPLDGATVFGLLDTDEVGHLEEDGQTAWETAEHAVSSLSSIRLVVDEGVTWYRTAHAKAWMDASLRLAEKEQLLSNGWTAIRDEAGFVAEGAIPDEFCDTTMGVICHTDGLETNLYLHDSQTGEHLIGNTFEGGLPTE